jgi:anaerobic magnesium-protoporphyrin IX monomethyl ester cyclase
MGKVVMRLDDLPFPAWDLLPNERYWAIKAGHGVEYGSKDEVVKYASIVTSLGCPFSCSYCHIGKETEGSLTQEIGRFRIKSDERVMEELEYLKYELGVTQIFIEDDSLFGRKKRALRLLEKIVELDLKLIDINGINIIHLLKKGKPDIEMIKLMKKAGFTDFSLPIESGNDRILKRWCSNKWDINNTDMVGLIKAFNNEGIRIDANYIIGFPDETYDEIHNTIKYAENNAKVGVDTSCFFICMPLPGTTMFDYCVEQP